jgi:hypothetical protein
MKDLNTDALHEHDSLIDESMLNMGEFLSQMTDVDGYLFDRDTLTAMRVERVNMSMPIQMDLQVIDDGSVVLGGSPPLYYTETTFLPVFHQLKITVVVEEVENREDNGGTK